MEPDLFDLSSDFAPVHSYKGVKSYEKITKKLLYSLEYPVPVAAGQPVNKLCALLMAPGSNITFSQG